MAEFEEFIPGRTKIARIACEQHDKDSGLCLALDEFGRIALAIPVRSGGEPIADVLEDYRRELERLLSLGKNTRLRIAVDCVLSAIAQLANTYPRSPTYDHPLTLAVDANEVLSNERVAKAISEGIDVVNERVAFIDAVAIGRADEGATYSLYLPLTVFRAGLLTDYPRVSFSSMELRMSPDPKSVRCFLHAIERLVNGDTSATASSCLHRYSYLSEILLSPRVAETLIGYASRFGLARELPDGSVLAVVPVYASESDKALVGLLFILRRNGVDGPAYSASIGLPSQIDAIDIENLEEAMREAVSVAKRVLDDVTEIASRSPVPWVIVHYLLDMKDLGGVDTISVIHSSPKDLADEVRLLRESGWPAEATVVASVLSPPAYVVTVPPISIVIDKATLEPRVANATLGFGVGGLQIVGIREEHVDEVERVMPSEEALGRALAILTESRRLPEEVKNAVLEKLVEEAMESA